jgi:hypothetical protein
VYRSLKPEKIVETAQRLQTRIRERFPESSLGRLSGEIHGVAQRAAETSRWLCAPNWPIRCGVAACILAMVLSGAGVAMRLHVDVGRITLPDLLQAVEAAVNDLVFLGIAVFFLVSWETRIKRRRALKAVHELRSLAHIIDMHQLTKDPEKLLASYATTPSSPERTMTPFELTRYLDYCSESLSLLSKVAAVYVQGFDDPVTLSAVNEVENLTTGLSRKIWHKIVVLDRLEGG